MIIRSSQPGNTLERVLTVQADVLEGVDEIWHKRSGFELLGVCESENVSLFSAKDVIIDVDGVV